jgi:hypothetical protein
MELSIQLGWYLAGFFTMLLLHSAGEVWKKEPSTARLQIMLALTVLILSISRIIDTWK